MSVVDGTSRFGRKKRDGKKLRIRKTFKATLRIPKVEFELLAVVFWCWLRNKQLNITAPMTVEIEQHLEDRDG